MNSLLMQTARWHRVAGEPLRSTPVDYIPLEERRVLLERLHVHLNRLTKSLGFDPGRLPTIISASDSPFSPADVLENTARLTVDCIAAFNTLGTADVARDAFEEVTDSLVLPSKTPNFQAIIEDALEPKDLPSD